MFYVALLVDHFGFFRGLKESIGDKGSPGFPWFSLMLISSEFGYD